MASNALFQGLPLVLDPQSEMALQLYLGAEKMEIPGFDGGALRPVLRAKKMSRVASRALRVSSFQIRPARE